MLLLAVMSGVPWELAQLPRAQYLNNPPAISLVLRRNASPERRRRKIASSILLTSVRAVMVVSLVNLRIRVAMPQRVQQTSRGMRARISKRFRRVKSMPWPKCYPPCVVLDLLAVSFLFARPPSLAVVNACFWYEIVFSFSFGQIRLSPHHHHSHSL